MVKKILNLIVVSIVMITTACSNPEQELRALINDIEQDVKPLRKEACIAQWDGSISGKEEDFAKYAQISQQITEYFSNKDIFNKLKEFKESNKIEDQQLKRELDILYNQFLSNKADTSVLNQIILKSMELEKIYGEYRATLNGKEINDNQVEDILRNSKNNKELQQVWESHKGIGPKVEKGLLEIVELRNKVAQQLGFDNYHTMSLKLSGQEPEEITALLDELDALTSKSFTELKNEMDIAFAKRYNVKKEDLMPWHYQGRYFQEAPNLYPINLDKFYADKNLEELTVNFFQSIGMDITGMIKNSSLYPQPGKNQHAFCTDIDGEGDVRILCNIAPNERWMDTMLHEYGHGVYAQGHDSSGLPYFLRDAAHIFTTEAIAMIFGRLSKNAEWMKQSLGLTQAQKDEIAENCFKATKLQQIVFSRWVQVVYRFEKEMYANPKQDLNELWWNLVEKYQQLKKPEGRNMPDYATKIHIALYPCYYHNYQLGELFASQMHYYIVDNITKSGNYTDECYIGNKEIGKWMQEKIFAPGMKYQWNNFIERATGEKLTAKYYAQQFQLN